MEPRHYEDEDLIPPAPSSPQTYGRLIWWGLFYAFIVCVILVIILAITGVFGPLFNTINNNLFNSSQNHLQGISSEISRDCSQMTNYKVGSSAYKAYEQDIYTELQQVSNIDDLNLSPALKACALQAQQDVLHPNP